MANNHHKQGAPATTAFRRCAEALQGLTIDECQDVTVSLLASVIVQHYRFEGMPLEFALECADAAIQDVKANIRTNWDR